MDITINHDEAGIRFALLVELMEHLGLDEYMERNDIPSLHLPRLTKPTITITRGTGEVKKIG